MTIKTYHQDTHGDAICIYRGKENIFIDGIFDYDLGEQSPVFRAIVAPGAAREIAKRLSDLADILEGK